MDLIWRVFYAVSVSAILWLLHSTIGNYPEPLSRSKLPRREIKAALMLWGVAVIFPIFRMYILSPWLDQAVTDRTLEELMYVPLLSIPYLALPLVIWIKLNNWSATSLGLTWRSQSGSVAIFAVLFGLLSGSIAFVSNQAVIGIDLLPVSVLVLLIYNNSFLEEFFHRAVIQSLLEKAIGQKLAILWGGILFGLTHVLFDFSMLMGSGGILFVFLAVLLQTMAGWLFGIIYMKTRSLWPGMVCHYLVNWLPSILALIFG